MKIPFADLGAQHKELKKEIAEAVNRVIRRGDFILGKDVQLFEEEFAKFCHVKYAVGVSSGTAALFLALISLGIGEGDEVIVPGFTFIATALAVSYTGATPVFVDIEEDSYNIDAEKIKKALTKNTKAIIPVHLYGQPADLPEIAKVAKEYNLKVIEDAAQAHGASIKMAGGRWQAAGSVGDMGCFSFYPSKNLGAMGDSGMITTNSREIYKKLLMLRDCGRVSKYEHKIVGYNSRLDTLQAAILRVKLKKLDTWNNMRMEAANIYNESLKDVRAVTTPYRADSLKHIFHVYAIRVKRRNNLLRALQDRGICAIIHYPIPLHMQKAYRYLGYKKGDFPVAEKISQEIISLPMYPHLKKSQILYVTDTIRKVLGS